MTTIMQDNKTVLAFDTTGKGTSISLYHKGSFIDHSLPDGGSQLQSSELIPTILLVCQQVHISLKDVSTVLTLAGPGSFTGIRLGLATAIGLKMALTCQTYAPSTLHLMVHKVLQKSPNHPCLVLIDTLRGDFYGLLVDQDGQELAVAQIYTSADVDALTQAYPQLTVITNHELDVTAKDLIQYYWQGTMKSEWAALTPYYVRDPQFVKQKRFQDGHS
jgi:tRNA threonylcarbamoyl adenosine modification protein YeaZ